MGEIKISRIDVKEKILDSDRDNLITVKELLGRELDVTDDLHLNIRIPLEINEIEYYLDRIKMPKFNNYESLLFILDGIEYQVNPHQANLGVIRLMRA